MDQKKVVRDEHMNENWVSTRNDSALICMAFHLVKLIFWKMFVVCTRCLKTAMCWHSENEANEECSRWLCGWQSPSLGGALELTSSGAFDTRSGWGGDDDNGEVVKKVCAPRVKVVDCQEVWRCEWMWRTQANVGKGETRLNARRVERQQKSQ